MLPLSTTTTCAQRNEQRASGQRAGSESFCLLRSPPRTGDSLPVTIISDFQMTSAEVTIKPGGARHPVGLGSEPRLQSRTERDDLLHEGSEVHCGDVRGCAARRSPRALCRSVLVVSSQKSRSMDAMSRANRRAASKKKSGRGRARRPNSAL